MTADTTLRRSPLGHLADVFAEHSTTGERSVRLREVPFLAQLDLQLYPRSAAVERIASALGEPLPTAPDTAVQAGDLRVLWLGPQQWLLIGPDGSAPATADLLNAALESEPGSVVDVSANRTTLELAAPQPARCWRRAVPWTCTRAPSVRAAALRPCSRRST